MFRLFRSLLAVGAVAIAINPAFAKIEANTIEELNAAISWHGCRQQLVRDEQLATLLVTCDEDVMRSDRDLRNWYFVSEMTDEYARANKEKLAASFGEWIAYKAMFIYYQADPALDQIVVIGNAVGYNDYGKPLDDITFNFGFDRELYQKVDPRHVNQKKIRRIAKRYSSYDLKLEGDE